MTDSAPLLPFRACLQQSAGQAAFDGDLNRELAQMRFRVSGSTSSPAATFRLAGSRCPKDDTTTGLDAVVTADLNVLTAVLTLDRAWRIGHWSLCRPDGRLSIPKHTAALMNKTAAHWERQARWFWQ